MEKTLEILSEDGVYRSRQWLLLFCGTMAKFSHGGRGMLVLRFQTDTTWYRYYVPSLATNVYLKRTQDSHSKKGITKTCHYAR
jgi:hypothetical protein